MQQPLRILVTASANENFRETVPAFDLGSDCHRIFDPSHHFSIKASSPRYVPTAVPAAVET